MSGPHRPTGYILISDQHATDFNPFDPDPIGALREAYAWITQPERMTPGRHTELGGQP
jgi:hypothetical protein